MIASVDVLLAMLVAVVGLGLGGVCVLLGRIADQLVQGGTR